MLWKHGLKHCCYINKIKVESSRNTKGGTALQVPTLTPFEAMVALGEADPWWAPGNRLRPGPGSGTGAKAAQTAHSGEPAAARSRPAAPQVQPGNATGDVPAAASGFNGHDSNTNPSRSDSPSSARSPTAAVPGCAAAASRTVPIGATAPAIAAMEPQQDAEWTADSDRGFDPYPMDYYAREGGVWGSSYHRKPAGRDRIRSEAPTSAV